MKKGLIGLGALLLLAIGAGPGLCAEVAGTVADNHSNPVSNVRISVVNMNGATVSAITTDSNGQYVFEGLAPGRYKFVGHSAGLNPA